MFEFEFTSDKVGAILSGNDQAVDWFGALTDNLPVFEIISILRVAAFMAQTTHESGNYKTLHENLNYKASSLIATWPKRFNASNAARYERKPEMIANYVYANRMGNGPEESGDGWLYKGRGILQITGKDNYGACSQSVYNDDRLLTNPELLETDMDASVKAACWFWNRANLNSLADQSDMKQITRKINGGYVGLDDRMVRYDNALRILQG